MSKNKLKKFDEMLGFPAVYQYPFSALQAEGGCPMRGRWGRDVFGNGQPVVLELGCGRGEYTVGLGRLFPDKNFIGIDIKGARMYSGAREANAAAMPNVAFLRTSIELLGSFFTSGEVSEIWLTFPDPQMKKSAKRLTSSRFMRLYSAILTDGGTVHLKTDSNFLYTYTLALIAANSCPVQISTSDLYASGLADDILSIRTAYEQQWIDRGITIKYLRFSCVSGDVIVEPNVEIEHDPYRSYNRTKRVSGV